MKRNESIQGSRASLLWTLIFFALIQVSLVGWVQALRPSPGYDPEYAQKLAKLRSRLRETGRPSSLTFAFGSSRVATGLQPESLVESQTQTSARLFNFGICRWVNPTAQAIVLNRLLRAGLQPDFVVFEVFPAYLGFERVQNPDPIRLGWDDLSVLDRYVEHPVMERLNWLGLRAVPAFSGRFVLLERWAPQWIRGDATVGFNWANLGNWGWTSLPHYARQYGLSHDVAQGYRQLLETWSADRASRQAYGEVLELCHRKGIGAALILMPEHSQIRGYYPPHVEAKLQTILDGLRNQFGAVVIDARTWADDQSFVDGIHLTHEGAKKFTRLLNAKALEPLIMPMLAARNAAAGRTASAP